MENYFLGWSSYQWRIAEGTLKRKPGSLNAHYASSQVFDRFVDAQCEWRTKFNFEPGQAPIPKVERKVMGTQPNFGFACKIIKMGWERDEMNMLHRYEIRVQVGDAQFGVRESASEHNFMYARDDAFKQYVERNALERLKREIVDKLFPNL